MKTSVLYPSNLLHMKKIITSALLVSMLVSFSCNNASTKADAETTTSAQVDENAGGQASVKDDESAKDVVKIAAGSSDHTTLVAAIKQAGLVNSLSNAGPFTVFAPTNAAFEKVGKETLDKLMKNENKEQLQDILQYHVYVGSLKAEMMSDGQTLNQVNGANVTVSTKDGKIILNNTATIVTSIPASNGIIHVIDAVLLPPGK